MFSNGVVVGDLTYLTEPIKWDNKVCYFIAHLFPTQSIYMCQTQQQAMDTLEFWWELHEAEFHNM